MSPVLFVKVEVDIPADIAEWCASHGPEQHEELRHLCKLTSIQVSSDGSKLIMQASLCVVH